MLSKLIIQKNEEGINSKSLCIVFENDKCTFGKWMDGIVDMKKKDIEQSQMIVKKALEEDMNNLDLKFCAKEISSSFKGICIPQEWKVKPETKNMCPNIKISSTGDCQLVNMLPKDMQDINPLEYSLERVKENNARIMENIHKLNRTLNYTKKKEMFDISSTKTLRSYPCEICGTSFVYETGLRRHYIMRHGTLEKQPRWQIVWTCTECFQVWPHQELALQHSKFCCNTENKDCIREIKTSLLLQCEFCEKVYTSIPRLLKHSKTHLTKKNYECNACKISFDNYKIAMQHWILCPWLVMCYKFSLPKMLLCNTCDRKFKTYDHLYNHRYKMGHFITKFCSDKNPNLMVHQCESCGQCFQENLQLTTHRHQIHGWFQSSSPL
ncbi:zinc finger protein 90-like isoform X1 [Pieris brassicae]|uniref:zinc finger protein 90-like isoform X1 n=1 Tax=Pieris brassicae TaxID=7116 RepID=UPI001E65F0AC|nr:zinc finger protein 90-like isoform X1 [Pieris brassicae]